MNEPDLVNFLWNAHDCIETFWRTVKENRLNFPRPTRMRCTAFAVTEVAEALDALIRNTSPHFNRASKDAARADFAGELCDVIFMSLSPFVRSPDVIIHLREAAHIVHSYESLRPIVDREATVARMALSAASAYNYSCNNPKSRSDIDQSYKDTTQTAAYAMWLLVEEVGMSGALDVLHNRLFFYRIAKIAPVIAEKV